MGNTPSARVKLIIIYDYADVPGEYTPGTEIIAILLVWRGNRYLVPWGTTHLIVIDFLCRYRWIALDSWQIAAKMKLDPFVQQHGSNAPGTKGRPARTSHSGARQQMKRIRDVLMVIIAETRIDLDVEDIIRRETSSSGTTRYRIVADVSWENLPGPASGGMTPEPHSPIVHPGGFSNAHGTEVQP